MDQAQKPKSLANEILWGSLSPNGYFGIAISFHHSLGFTLTIKFNQQDTGRRGPGLEIRELGQGDLMGIFITK